MNTVDRTEVLAHYIIYRARPDKLGATKLNKVMWFSDVESFKRFGKTISGQYTYERKKFGPVPNKIKECLKSLVAERKIATRYEMTPSGERHEFVWTEEPELSLFTAQELDIINRNIDWICDNFSATGISNKTHDTLWKETEDGDQIEVRAGTVIPKAVSGKYLTWALKQVG